MALPGFPSGTPRAHGIAHVGILIAGMAMLFAAAGLGAQELPAGAPTPPLAIDAPAAPPQKWREYDLTTLEPTLLRSAASKAAYEQGRDEEAIQLQHWAVEAEPTRGVYSLAIYHAMAGSVDGAMYWLQRAALQEGVAADWPATNPRFAAVVADARWSKLELFLRETSEFWANQRGGRMAVNVPRDHADGAPMPIVVALHGYYGYPEETAGDAPTQRVADELGAAVVAISGTIRCGPDRYTWSEDPARDQAHIDEVLAGLATELEFAGTPRIVLGFSQGAQVGIELAARQPGVYAGAIALAPYSAAGSKLQAIESPDPALAGLGVVLITGDQQPEEDLTLAAADAEWLRERGAMVIEHTHQGLGRAWPPSAYDSIAIWAQLLFAARARK